MYGTTVTDIIHRNFHSAVLKAFGLRMVSMNHIQF
jgi:hypothetical protein